MSVAATQNSLYQRAGKGQGGCRLVSLTILYISANYFNSAMKCMSRWMHRGVGKHSERQPRRVSTLHVSTQPRTDPSLSPVAPLKKRKVPLVMWAMPAC